MGRYGAFSLSSNYQMKCQILLTEDITPHSCVEGSQSSDSAHKRRNAGDDEKSASVKKHKAHQKNNSVDDRRANGNDENQNPGGPRRTLCTEDQETTVKRFACLFQKFDPASYNSCASRILVSWDRVLQHLKRKHLLDGEYCPVCRKEFKGNNSEDNKNEHIRARCQPTTAIETGRLIPKEYDELTGIGPGDQVTKWLKGWTILFRGYPEPLSPFAETLLEVNCNLIRGRIPEIVQSFRRNRGQNLTDGDLADLVGQIVDEVERGRLHTTLRQVLQLAPAPLSTGSDTMVAPLEYEVSVDYNTPAPSFGSNLTMVPNIPLSLLESQSSSVIHWPISDMILDEPLPLLEPQSSSVMHWPILDMTSDEPPDGSFHALTTIPDSLDHFTVSQPPMLQWEPPSHEQDPDNIFQQSFDASIFRQSIDSWMQDPNDAVTRFVDFSGNPVLEDGIEDVTNFADNGGPI
ncbi:hypothetical protein BKA59DRAFT_449021 [Fusarium tricinctum]|uniref:C2H2-type domain-containing protein n=1 Tax=Fusarium tricinctum TaxID=61284 RepID=A0A8K0SAD6_9HYPO|nr:hypothetical protein BKA59DRAFT_449021 [Fusarium tricinctum]